MKKAWLDWLVALPAVVLLVLAWAAPYPHIPFFRDSSTYAYLGLELLHGRLPIRDFWDQKPGAIAWVDAAAFLVSTPGQQALFWLDIVFSFGVVAAAAWAVSGLAGRLPTAAVLAWAVLFYRLPNVFEGGNLTEQYALIPAFVGLGAGVRALRCPPDRRMRWAVVAGLAAGLAALFKPTAGTAAPALVLALLVALVQSRDNGYLRAAVACVASAAGVVVLALTGYMAAETSPRDLYADLIAYNSKYPPPFGIATLKATYHSLILHRELQIPIAAVLIRAAAELLGRRLTPIATLVVAAMGLDVAGVIAPGFFYGHYFLLLTPSFTVGLAWAVGGIGTRLARPLPVTRFPRITLDWALTAVLVLLLLVYFPVFALLRPNGLAALAAGLPIPPADSAAVQAVDRVCRPQQPIYVWGNEPEIYVVSGHPSSSRYIYLAPLQMPGYDNQQRIAQLISDLAAAPPCAVVDASNGYPNTPPLDDSERARWPVPVDHRVAYLGLDRLYEYINSRYTYKESAGGYRILVPRTP